MNLSYCVFICSTYPTSTGTTQESVSMLRVKELYIWCMRADERGKKKGCEKENKFCRIVQCKAWHRFCSNSPDLEEDSIHDRILVFIDAIDDPFAEDILP